MEEREGGVGYLDVDDGPSISFLKSRISDHIWMWTMEMEQREGGVGCFSNEGGFSVECSLQRISSNCLSEMKHSVSSNVNVMLTRQTCGQRSSMVAGSKRRATIY